MDSNDSDRRRRMGRTTLQLVPVLWIAILLVFWFVIVEWKELPDLLTSTMASWH